MPSLEEIRLWMQGEPIEGMPDNAWQEPPESRKGGVDIGRLREDAPARAKFRVIDNDGMGRPDAIIHFGRHAGKAVSVMAEDTDSRDYLRWILKEDFSEELKDIVKAQLNEVEMLS